MRPFGEESADVHRKLLGGPLAGPASGSPVVSLDNVAGYWASTLGAGWLEPKDLPALAPPFGRGFFEYRYPKAYGGLAYDAGALAGAGVSAPDAVGVAVEGLDRRDDEEAFGRGLANFLEGRHALSSEEGVRWILALYPYVGFGGRWSHGPLLCLSLAVREDGTMAAGEEGTPSARVRVFDPPEQDEGVKGRELVDHALAWLQPVLLGISFAHCKNVTYAEQDPPEKLSKKHRKKHGAPLVRYRVLEIEPMKEVLRREGRAEETGLKRALHICRGHFRTYVPERGGPGGRRITEPETQFVRQHVRGSREAGASVKDYDVLEPAEAPAAGPSGTGGRA